MTATCLQSILAGPVSDRPAHANWLMTEAEARGVLHFIEKIPRKKRRDAVNFFAESPHGRLTDEARALYRAYVAAYTA